MPVAVGLLLVAMAITTAALAAITLRLTSLVSTLLVTYLFYLANLGLVIIVLSPLELVTRAGLAVAEGVLLAAALAAWWLRGRPAPPLAAARAAARAILTRSGLARVPRRRARAARVPGAARAGRRRTTWTR